MIAGYPSLKNYCLQRKRNRKYTTGYTNAPTSGNILITFASTKPENSCVLIMSQNISAGCLKNSVSKRFDSTISNIVTPVCCGH